MEDSSGMTPAMDNNSNNKRSFGQHCNAIVSFLMKQKTLIRFFMAISLILVSGFMVKLFSSAAMVDSSAHVKVDTTHSYNADKLVNTSRDDNVVKEPLHGWQTFGFLQIREHFSCDLSDYVLKPPSMKKWQMTHNKEVDSSSKLDDIVPPTQGYFSFEEIGGSFKTAGAPPFYAKSSNMGRRRGLFASRDMRKGEVVHDGTDSDVVFPDAMAYRRFVFALPRRTASEL